MPKNKNPIYEFANKRLACLGMAVYFFFVYGSTDEWYFESVREVLIAIGGGNDAAPFYASLFFLFFAVFGGKIIKIFFSPKEDDEDKPELNPVKQAVTGSPRVETIADITSRLPAHLQELISKG